MVKTGFKDAIETLDNMPYAFLYGVIREALVLSQQYHEKMVEFALDGNIRAYKFLGGEMNEDGTLKHREPRDFNVTGPDGAECEVDENGHWT